MKAMHAEIPTRTKIHILRNALRRMETMNGRLSPQRQDRDGEKPVLDQ